MSVRFSRRVARTLAIALIALPVLATPAAAHLCWWYSSQLNRFTFSEPWDGGFCASVPDPGSSFDPTDQDTWDFLHYHCNWHDIHGLASSSDVVGLQFLAFHRQLFLDFDIYRICGDAGPGETSPCETIDGPVGERIEPYDPKPGNPIPGNDENTFEGYDRGGACAPERPAAQDCVGCYELPAAFRGEALAGIASLAEVGHELDWSGLWGDDWHGRFHTDIGNNSGAQVDHTADCNDIGPPQTSPRDPAFWMAHKELDEVARLWQSCQPTDFVVVVDRSGSMNDNCATDTDGDGDGDQPDAGESPCKINDAKTAAKAFADFVPNGGGHRIAVVSFGSDPSTEVGFTSVDAGLAAIQAAIDGIEIDCAPGNLCRTSIGDGIDEALGLLAASAAEHKAILLLTDGMENEPQLIDDVSGDVPIEVQICAIGYGVLFEDDEDALRRLCEEHGGILIADDDLLEDGEGGVTLTKYFIDCFSELACEARVVDPVTQMPAGQVASAAIPIQLCGSEVALSAIVARQWGAGFGGCSLSVVLETPSGALVDPTDPLVESGNKTGYQFERVKLPYHGELPGPWNAYVVRPQRTYTHGFVTDAFVNHEQGIALARREIHRLFPAGCNNALYYEDGSLSGRSAYRDALQRELAAGTINSLTTATSPADFSAKLMLNWDLIVFARQVDPTAKPYDAQLSGKICQGQKALITDFYQPAGGPNPILTCAGTIRGMRVNWNQLVGDGRLITGNIALSNPGYPVYTFEVSAATAGGPWLLQARNELNTGSIVGLGSPCGPQWYSYSVLARGLGRVTPYAVKPWVRLGENILATFRLPTPQRPMGDWDAVSATVTLDRPGPGAPEVYTLVDDGTSGDRVIKNNLWTRLIPIPATSAGPHVLSARFALTKGTCTVTREAEYSIMVHPNPNRCTAVSWPKPQTVARGGAVAPPMCIVNRCSSRDSFRVTVSANPPWLCQIVNGNRTPVSVATFNTHPADADAGVCMPLQNPSLFVCVPPSAPRGDSTVVSYLIHSLGRANERDTTVRVVVKSSGGTAPTPVAVLEPPPGFWIRGIPNSVNHTVNFEMRLPFGGHAALKLYDITGRRIATLFDENMRAGVYGGSGHEAHAHGGGRGAVWNEQDETGQRVKTGVYFYRLTLDRYAVSGSVVVLW